MIELLTTRHNPLVDPTLHVWEWQIPVYLFLGGWVAGSMVLTGYLQRQARAAAVRSWLWRACSPAVSRRASTAAVADQL